VALVEWPDFDRAKARVAGLGTLTEADLEPLFIGWERDLFEAHRKNVFSAIQPDGTPTPPVTYRTGISKPTKARRGGKYGAKLDDPGQFGGFKGFGPFQSGLHNNLSEAEYHGLTGPPLAPRGDDSRIITNFRTDFRAINAGQWEVVAWLEDIVDFRGSPFMTRDHFNGGSGKVRDYRGLSAWGLDRIRNRLRDFVADDLLKA